MSNEENQSNEIFDEVDFSEMQLSAITEIQNISMGSAATAVSNMLGLKVIITTPSVKIVHISKMDYPRLDPAIKVDIDYTKGVVGKNTMILKQDDVQMILNQLMGMPLELSPDFVFDELNISAVCEVMNQMMGSSSTALSEFLGTTIDISTPVATVLDNGSIVTAYENPPEDYAVEVHFNLMIGDVIKSEFMSILGLDLARILANSMLQGFDEDTTQEPVSEPVVEQKMPEVPPTPVSEPLPPAPEPFPLPPMPDLMQNTAPVQPLPQATPLPMQQPMYQQPMYQQPMYQQPPMNIQGIQLQQFAQPVNPNLSKEQQDNLNLLMDVPLGISIEIGKATRNVKEILEFNQGTIIELDKQAGAPVDIIVNGHLIARGDVVVIDDNFAVRVSEILKSKLLDSLHTKE